MTDVLGRDSQEYYTKEEVKRYNRSGAFKRIQELMTRTALEISHFKQDSKVLDLGCGTGFSTKVIKDSGFNVIGCDINQYMLEHAENKSLSVVRCDMKSLPFKNESFDYIISISTIQWSEPKDYYIILEEINRVIKSDAVIQFYPNSEEERDLFYNEAKKLFTVKEVITRDDKKYVMLKKR